MQQLLEKNYRIHCSVHNIVSRKCCCCFNNLLCFKMSISYCFIYHYKTLNYEHFIGPLKDSMSCITSRTSTLIVQCCCVFCRTYLSSLEYSILFYWHFFFFAIFSWVIIFSQVLTMYNLLSLKLFAGLWIVVIPSCLLLT